MFLIGLATTNAAAKSYFVNIWMKDNLLPKIIKYQDENGRNPSTKSYKNVGDGQCDQIGRFIGLWASF